MRSLLVVVADVLPQDLLKVVFAEDEDVVQTLMPDGFHEALGEGVALGERIGVRITRTPSQRNTSSNGPE